VLTLKPNIGTNAFFIKFCTVSTRKNGISQIQFKVKKTDNSFEKFTKFSKPQNCKEILDWH